MSNSSKENSLDLQYANIWFWSFRNSLFIFREGVLYCWGRAVITLFRCCYIYKSAELTEGNLANRNKVVPTYFRYFNICLMFCWFSPHPERKYILFSCATLVEITNKNTLNSNKVCKVQLFVKQTFANLCFLLNDTLTPRPHFRIPQTVICLHDNYVRGKSRTSHVLMWTFWQHYSWLPELNQEGK